MSSPELERVVAAPIAAFINKWHAREPEMVYAEVFCPRGLRLPFALWGALLFELREAAFELSDARVIEVKAAWWADELHRCAQGSPRHPLTQALESPEVAWNELAHGMLTMAHADAARPIDRDAALAAVAPLAAGLAAVEAALFDVAPSEEASRAVAVHLLAERLRFGLGSADGGGVPLMLLARHGITSAALAQPAGTPAVADWAATLADALPRKPVGLSLYRSTRTAFDTWFLHELATNQPRRAMPRLRALRLAWSAARQSRLAR